MTLSELQNKLGEQIDLITDSTKTWQTRKASAIKCCELMETIRNFRRCEQHD